MVVWTRRSHHCPASPIRPSFTSQHGAGRWGSRPAGPELGQEGSIRRSAPGIERLGSAFPARRGVNPKRRFSLELRQSSTPG
jgi:hypothetical protein